MKSKNNGEKLELACDFLKGILKSKNKDYDNSFEKTVKEYGLITIPITLEHKLRRITNIIKGHKPHCLEEQIDDSLMDLAGYALLSVVVLDNRREKNAKKSKRR